jgi:hypothetical protein
MKTQASVIHRKTMYDDRKIIKNNLHYLIKFDEEYYKLLEDLQQKLSFKKNHLITKKLVIQTALKKLALEDLATICQELLDYSTTLPKAVRKRKKI